MKRVWLLLLLCFLVVLNSANRLGEAYNIQGIQDLVSCWADRSNYTVGETAYAYADIHFTSDWTNNPNVNWPWYWRFAWYFGSTFLGAYDYGRAGNGQYYTYYQVQMPGRYRFVLQYRPWMLTYWESSWRWACEVSVSVQQPIQPPPTTTARQQFPLRVSISASTTSGVAPLEVTFSSRVAGGTSPYDYNWDFGDGESSYESEPDHVFFSAGYYEVTLQVTDSRGNTATSKTLGINVNEPLTTTRRSTTSITSTMTYPSATTYQSSETLSSITSQAGALGTLFVAGAGSVVTDIAANAIAEAAGLQAVGTAAASGAAGFFIPSVAGGVVSHFVDEALRETVPNEKDRCAYAQAAGAVTGCVTGAVMGLLAFGALSIAGCIAGGMGSLAVGTALSCSLLPGLVSSEHKDRLKLARKILSIHFSDPRLYLYYAISFLGFLGVAASVSGLQGAGLIIAIVLSASIVTVLVRTAFTAHLNKRIGIGFQFSLEACLRLWLLLVLALLGIFAFASVLPLIISVVLILFVLLAIAFCEPAFLTEHLDFFTGLRKSLQSVRDNYVDFAVLIAIFAFGAGLLGILVLNFSILSWPALGFYGLVLAPLPSAAPHLLYQSKAIGIERNRFCVRCGSSLRTGAQYCLKCGESVRRIILAPMQERSLKRNIFCLRCGSRLRPDAKFCLKCGENVMPIEG